MSELQIVLDAAEEYNERVPLISMNRDYYDGNHRLEFASPKFRDQFKWIVKQAQENLCEVAAVAYTDMLRINSWGESVPTESDSSLKGLLNRLQRMVHLEQHITGNAFVWNTYKPGTKDVVPTFHRADQIIPQVDDNNPSGLSSAVKFWVDENNLPHGTLVTNDRWYRFMSKTPVTRKKVRDLSKTFRLPPTKWQAVSEDQIPEEPHWFNDVPVVWFKLNATTQFDWGVSMLKNAIPIQDELNKMIADALISSERIALPLRYVLQMAQKQMSTTIDLETGRPRKNWERDFDEMKDRIMTLSAAGPAGQFEGPDAGALIALQQHAEDKFGRVIGLPPHYLQRSTGQIPSGEALRVVSQRMTSAAEGTQMDNDPCWVGQLSLMGYLNAQPEWATPMPVDDLERLEMAARRKNLGMAPEDYLSVLGEGNLQEMIQRAAEEVAKNAVEAGRAFREGTTQWQ